MIEDGMNGCLFPESRMEHEASISSMLPIPVEMNTP